MSEIMQFQTPLALTGDVPAAVGPEVPSLSTLRGWLLPLRPSVGGVRDGIWSMHLRNSCKVFWCADTGLLGERLEWGNGRRPSLPFLQFQVNMVHDSVDSALVNIVQVVRCWKTQEASRHQRGAGVALRRGKTPVANQQS